MKMTILFLIRRMKILFLIRRIRVMTMTALPTITKVYPTANRIPVS